MPPETATLPAEETQAPAKKPSRFAKNTVSDDVLLIGLLSGRLRHNEVFPDTPKGSVPQEGQIRKHLKSSYSFSPTELDDLISSYWRGDRSGVWTALDEARKKHHRNTSD